MIDLKNDYECFEFNSNISYKEYVDPNKRDEQNKICRFCGKTQSNVSFDKCAHAISAGLGNTKLFLYEECDECNKNNGKFEQEFIEWFNFYRVMYSIEKRNGQIPVYSSSPSIAKAKLQIHSLEYELAKLEEYQTHYKQHIQRTPEIQRHASKLACLRIKADSYGELSELYSESASYITVSMPDKSVIYSDVYRGLLTYFIG